MLSRGAARARDAEVGGMLDGPGAEETPTAVVEGAFGVSGSCFPPEVALPGTVVFAGGGGGSEEAMDSGGPGNLLDLKGALLKRRRRRRLRSLAASSASGRLLLTKPTESFPR